MLPSRCRYFFHGNLCTKAVGVLSSNYLFCTVERLKRIFISICGGYGILLCCFLEEPIFPWFHHARNSLRCKKWSYYKRWETVEYPRITGHPFEHIPYIPPKTLIQDYLFDLRLCDGRSFCWQITRSTMSVVSCSFSTLLRFTVYCFGQLGLFSQLFI